jgi:hypothetical protein
MPRGLSAALSGRGSPFHSLDRIDPRCTVLGDATTPSLSQLEKGDFVSSLLSAAHVVDLVRSYANLTPLTTVKIFVAGTQATADLYKGIGPNHIDIGSSAYTMRLSLDEQFYRVEVFGLPEDAICLHFPSGTIF